MKSGDPSSEIATNQESTGLPGLHTWPLVYLLVMGSFVVWVLLLLALERFFS